MPLSFWKKSNGPSIITRVKDERRDIYSRTKEQKSAILRMKQWNFDLGYQGTTSISPEVGPQNELEPMTSENKRSGKSIAARLRGLRGERKAPTQLTSQHQFFRYGERFEYPHNYWSTYTVDPKTEIASHSTNSYHSGD
jgi:hypothetical protein